MKLDIIVNNKKFKTLNLQDVDDFIYYFNKRQLIYKLFKNNQEMIRIFKDPYLYDGTNLTHHNLFKFNINGTKYNFNNLKPIPKNLITFKKMTSSDERKLQINPKELLIYEVGESWSLLLDSFYKKAFPLLKELENEDILNPNRELVFRAFKECPLEKVKVIILGQDPYPNANQTNGLAFGHPLAVSLSPTIQNINKELLRSTGKDIEDYTLISWAKQGVLLLNSSLTNNCVINGHKKQWEPLTKDLINSLSVLKKVLFVSLGVNAKELLTGKVQNHIHFPHPSSDFYGSPTKKETFYNSDIFIEINKKLAEMNHIPIDWSKDLTIDE